MSLTRASVDGASSSLAMGKPLDGQAGEHASLRTVDHDRLARLEAEVAQLREAMLTQRQIGSVIGLLAARFGCTTDVAWTLLVRLSMETHTKLRIVARVLQEAHNGCPDPADGALRAEIASRLPDGGPWLDRADPIV